MGDQIKVGVGEQYILTLIPIASAGYTWDYVVEGEPSVVDIAEAILRPPPSAESNRSPMPGTSFEEQFIIKGKKPGHTNIRFLLHRPWEQDKPPVDDRVFEVTVQP